MQLIHRFNPISGPFFVTLLIVTQTLAPLIHGHGGYKEPIRGFHMPGFENLSRTTGRVDVGSTSGFQTAGPELIISVASGIESKHPDEADFDDQEIFALILFVCALVYLYSGASSRVSTEVLPLRRVWAHQPSRAPPHF